MRTFLVMMLVLSVFIFGCTSSGGVTTQGNVSVNQNPSGNNDQVMVNSTTNVSNGANNAAVSANTSVTANGPNLGGLGYTALLALGVPIQCKITENSTTSTLYMDGKGKVRVEGSGGSGNCSTSVAIMNGNKVDISCVGSQVMPGCDWLEIETNSSTNASAGNPSQGGPGSMASDNSAPDLNALSSTQFNCQPWIEDSSKFVVSGKACNFMDIMNKALGNLSANIDVSGGMNPPQPG